MSAMIGTILNLLPTTSLAQGSAFTYQGKLASGGTAPTGLYDFRFKLYSDSLGNTQVGSSYLTNSLGVTNGLFTTTMDFGADKFNGASYWLEVDVKTNAAGSYTVLTPLQALTPIPYAIFAGSASNLNGTLPVTQLSGTLATTQLPSNAVTNNATGLTLTGTFTGNGSGLTGVNATTLGGLSSTGFWKTNGNTGANPTNGAFLGTTDNLPLEFQVNTNRALRLEYAANATYGISPNVIGGYAGNAVSNGFAGAFIGGGGNAFYPNKVGYNFASVLGGMGNTASGFASTAMGMLSSASGFCSMAEGYSVIASGNYSTALGAYNTASGHYSIAMGNYSVASGYYSTAMGLNTTASGDDSTALGLYTVASGLYAIAMGTYANATNLGTLVWGDNSGSTLVTSTNDNSVTFRAAGGYRLFSNSGMTAGAYLAANSTAWAVISDRNAKKDFAAIDPVDILEKLAAMPVTQWHYKWETADTTPHIGPMAQDFKHAFYPGSDDKSITTLEADGVAFAAIQGLNQKLEAQQHQIAQKDTELTELKTRLERLEKLLAQAGK